MNICLVPTFVFFAIMSVGCQGQNQEVKREAEYAYLSFPMPYIIEGHKAEFKLPESVSRGRKGNAVIEAFLNHNGELEGFNLTYLRLSGSSSEDLKHYKYSQKIIDIDEYPEEVQEFLPLFKEYLSGLTFIRDNNVKLNDKSKYLIKIPLKLE